MTKFIYLIESLQPKTLIKKKKIENEGRLLPRELAI